MDTAPVKPPEDYEQYSCDDKGGAVNQSSLQVMRATNEDEQEVGGHCNSAGNQQYASCQFGKPSNDVTQNASDKQWKKWQQLLSLTPNDARHTFANDK